MKRITKCNVLFSCMAAGLFLVEPTYSDEPTAKTFDAGLEKSFMENAQQPGSVMFNPPEGWHLADPKALPPSVKIMVVGQGSNDFPPSINLGTEKFEGNLNDYLQMIKDINTSQGSDWKNLGTIRTQAGTASLSQVDAKTEWGEVRMMHVILLREGISYILTAAALKEEFPKFYKDFFKSMRSLRFNSNVLEMVSNPLKRQCLEAENNKLKEAWSDLCNKELSSKGNSLEAIGPKLFSSEEFQTKHWEPFKEKLTKEYRDMGKGWQQQLLNQVRNELLNKGAN